jgi:Uma2 family endonuclease
MSTVAKSITPEEFAQRDDADEFELVKGELSEREMSNLTVEIAVELLTLLRTYCRQMKAGWALGDNTSYRCFRNDPLMVRKPDASYFTAARWSPTLLQAIYIDVAPDLVVEVVSPNDVVPDLFDKIDQFFEAGSSEAWIIHPTTRQLDRRYPDGRARWYKADETIDATPLIPGFIFRAADLLTTIQP